MKIQIKGTNMNLTDEISDYLHKKINMLEKFIDPNDTSVLCEVEIGRTTNHHKSGDVFRTEINIRQDGKHFRAVAEQESVMASIDEAKDEMSLELSNYKSKKITLLRRGGAAIKNMLKGIGGVGYGIGSGIGSGLGSGYNKIKKINWRQKRRD